MSVPPLTAAAAAAATAATAAAAACFRVENLNGKSYRLVQNNLDKDIVVDESKFLVKKDKVIVKLQKVRTKPRPACVCLCVYLLF